MADMLEALEYAEDPATSLPSSKMVKEFGLSPKVGPVGYPWGGPMFLGGGQEIGHRTYAEETQRLID